MWMSTWKGVFQQRLAYSTFADLTAACSEVRNDCSQTALNKLAHKIITLDYTNAPNSVKKDLVDAVTLAVSSSSKTNRVYFLNKVNPKQGPPAWIKFYMELHKNKPSAAVKLFKEDPMIQFVTVSYAQALLEEGNTAEFLRYYRKFRNTGVLPEELNLRFIEKCIEYKDNESLLHFLELYVLYTGESEAVKDTMVDIDHILFRTILKFFVDVNDVKAYSKCVSWRIKTWKSEKDLSPNIKGKIHDLRIESRLEKFSMYTKQLGPLEVLKNGMFHRFGFMQMKTLKFEDLEPFTKQLSEYLIERQHQGENLNIEKVTDLMDLMHGIKIQREKQAFSKSLNPDIQMSRIYKWIIDRSESSKNKTPDPEIVAKYDELLSMSHSRLHTHMRDHIPKKSTRNQELNETGIEKTNVKKQSLRYQALSLQIIMRVLKNLHKATEETQLKHSIAEMASRIFKTAVQEHAIIPPQLCFQDMYEIFDAEDEVLKAEVPVIKSIEKYFYHDVQTTVQQESL